MHTYSNFPKVWVWELTNTSAKENIIYKQMRNDA